MKVKAVLGLATLHLPKIRYRALWTSEGNGCGNLTVACVGLCIDIHIAVCNLTYYPQPSQCLCTGICIPCSGNLFQIHFESLLAYFFRNKVRLVEIAALSAVMEWGIGFFVDFQRLKALLVET